MIRIAKVVLNIGVGEAGEKLQKAEQLLASLVAQKPIRTYAKSTITEFNVKKYSPIGVKVTLRGTKAREFLEKAFVAIENQVKKSQFDANGNLAFGIKEYIEIPGTKYNPDIGMFGMDVCVNLEEIGGRIVQRKIRKRKKTGTHINIDESTRFIQENFKVKISE